MVVVEKKRHVGKSKKKHFYPKCKNGDMVVGELDSRIRCAKSLHSIVRQVYSQYSSTSRVQKFEKARFSFPNDENIMKRYLEACDTIVVFQTDDIPPVIRPVKSTKIPVVLGKKNAVPLPAPPRTAASAAHAFGGPLYQVDQEYRSRYRVSSLYKPTYDLLPSPALFTLHVTGINEGSRFLQEVALEKMRLFTCQFIEKNPEKTTISRAKVCLQCETDFSPTFICIDQKKTKFLCDKCTSKKQRADAANLDILSSYAENALPSSTVKPPVLEENNATECASAQKPVHAKIAVHKNSPIVTEINIRNDQSVPYQKKTVESVRSVSKQPPPGVHRAAYPAVQNVPRLIAHGNNPLRAPGYHQPQRHEMVPPYNTVHAIQTGPRFFSSPQIPATQSIYPVFVPISSLSNMSVQNNMGIQKVQATTIHYRPQREIIYPNNHTPVLRENLPSNPINSLHPKIPLATPGLRLVRIPNGNGSQGAQRHTFALQPK